MVILKSLVFFWAYYSYNFLNIKHIKKIKLIIDYNIF